MIKALAKRGFREEADNLLSMVKLRVSGDYLQTSAMVRNGRIVSAVNDPNDYAGPGTGYRVTPSAKREISAIRDVLDPEEVLRAENVHRRPRRKRISYRTMGEAEVGTRSARGRHRHLAGLRCETVPDASPAIRCRACCGELIDGIAEGGGRRAIVRMKHTADTSFLGLQRRAARRLGRRHRHPGQGHRGDPPEGPAAAPQSRAVLQRADHPARALPRHGPNAAAYAEGELPEPIVVPYRGEANGARHHARVALIYAIETELTPDGAARRRWGWGWSQVAKSEGLSCRP